MRTLYYVNGKRTDLRGYLNAEDFNDYQKEALKRAIKYYEAHPFEWSLLCPSPEEAPHPTMVILDYERTKEGQEFRRHWDATKQDRMESTAISVILCSIIFVLIFLALLL